MHKLFNLSGEIGIFEEKKCKANGAHETINDFACNFAKCAPILKNSFTGRLTDKCAVKELITP